MSLFRKLLAEHEAEKKREYELANPCMHDGSLTCAFNWNGQTLCSNCCKHEYKVFIDTWNGIRACTLCWTELEQVYSYGPPPKRRRLKRKNPKICVSDENGKQRRARYH